MPQKIQQFFLLLFLLFFLSCSTVNFQNPEIADPKESFKQSTLIYKTEDFSVIKGYDKNLSIEWEAVITEFHDTPVGADTVKLKAAPENIKITDSGSVLSCDPADSFENNDTLAVLTGSMHNPLRYSEGREQQVIGFLRINGKTVSQPDNKHYALGIKENCSPEVLSPSEQHHWKDDALCGTYPILLDGTPLAMVPVRDALSAAGWSKDGNKLIFLVIKGYKNHGYSYQEAGMLIKLLGARNALALDGGSSAVLMWKDENGIEKFPSSALNRKLPDFLIITKDQNK